MIRPSTARRQQRRNRLSSAIALSVAVGCVSVTTGCTSSLGARVASLNPFSGSKTETKQESDSMFAGWFGGGDKKPQGNRIVVEGDETDPTSLAHKAEVTPEVFVANGRLWESTGNYEKAMESYAKALEKQPNDPAALANIARLHFRQKNHEKAAEYFGKAIKEKPDDAGLYNDLGLTLSRLGNHSAAATTIEQALRLSPGSSRYANNLASVKFESGDAAGALQVLVTNNKPAVAHYNMAYLHYKRGQATDSVRHLNEALAYQPNAATDPATKRAVERSRELLAQLGNMPGNANIAGLAKGNAGQSAAQAGAAQAAAAQAAARTAAMQGMPAQAVAGPSQPMGAPSANLTGAVKAASTGTNNVNFGNATYRTLSDNGVNPAGAIAPAQQAPTASGTPAAAPGGKFALPPGFQMPQ